MLRDDEISYMPVAKMNLQTDVREHIEVLRILDQKLANQLKVINPEYELGTTLMKEPEKTEAKPGRSSLEISEQYEQTQKGTLDGKEITIGLRDGKWYNIETGEEIKL